MAGFKYTQYDDQLLRELKRETRGKRERIAARIMADAIATAPVESGEFRSRFYMETGEEPRVVNSDPGAEYIEFGTSRTPAHGTLVNAARKYGKYTGWTP